MSNERRITINTEVEKCIKAIGTDLISRAEDIARDLERVRSISISATIVNGEIVGYDVNKEYSTNTFIDYRAIRSGGDNDDN